MCYRPLISTSAANDHTYNVKTRRYNLHLIRNGEFDTSRDSMVFGARYGFSTKQS